MKPVKCIGNKFQLRHVMHPLVIDIIEAARSIAHFLGGAMEWFLLKKQKLISIFILRIPFPPNATI